MALILLSFLSGILTVLAPCAFMLLPIIIGGSAGSTNKARPYIITASLALSLFLFTVLLKITSLFVNVNPVYISIFSGIVIILLGVISLFPRLWDRVQIALKLSNKSDELLNKAESQKGLIGAILTGAALGPVFSSCSPTFVFVLTTVLRESVISGFLNIIAYIIGLSLIMLLISIFGQAFTKRARWAVNPTGIFKRAIAIIYIIVGIAILTGFDARIREQFAQLPFVADAEQSLLNKATGTSNNDSEDVLNVKNPYPAPEIQGIAGWINSDGERIEDLKGQVVLIDFWTYSCINCRRTAPYLNQWYTNYHNDGLQILGIHAPEFSFEKNQANVEKAVREDYKYQFPVGLDNDYKTWDAYNNKFWPAKYLIDADGNVRYTHFGEGDYEGTEAAIRLLLKEAGKEVNSETSINKSNDSDALSINNQAVAGQTPETYLGWSRLQNFANKSELKPNQEAMYTFPPELLPDYWALSGTWRVQNERAECISDTCSLRLNFTAKDVYIVASLITDENTDFPEKRSMYVRLNRQELSPEQQGQDAPDSTVEVNKEGMYQLVGLEAQKSNQLLRLNVDKGVALNVFTFGS